MIPETGAHVPEDKDQRVVLTPYGKALVVRTRAKNGMRELELLDWHKQSGKPSILYSPARFPSVPAEVGSDVLCVYGRGRVVALRPDIGVVVVRLSSWRLAHRSTVTCYLSASQVEVVRPKHAYEMSVVEKVERAVELKQQAAAQFRHKFYREALQTYARAVDTVKYVQHKADSTNTVRADLLVVMITCSNNAATCCSQLERWDDAHQHAQHATALTEALERKAKEGGVSRIHQEILAAGHTDIKVFGEWKVKSLLVTARALIEKGEFGEATDVIKSARETVANYINTTAATQDAAKQKQHQQSVKHLQRNDKELLKLLSLCKERRKAQLKKEKQRALAMFGSSSTAAAKERPSSPSSAEEKKCESIPATMNIAEDKQQQYKTSTDSASSTPSTSPRTVMSPTENGAAPQAKAVAKKKVSFADDTRKDDDDDDDDDTDQELVWHKDPAFLGGLGVVIGVAGTMLILSQWGARRK